MNVPFVIMVKDNHNTYDANALKIYAINNDKWCHVGFVQRHAAIDVVDYFADDTNQMFHGQYFICQPFAKQNEWFVKPVLVSTSTFSHDSNKLLTYIKDKGK